MFYTEEEVSVITGLLNAYLVREHASEKVRESYTRISEGLQSRVLTRDDYVWLENALLLYSSIHPSFFIRQYSVFHVL